jgi:hypothetical protein
MAYRQIRVNKTADLEKVLNYLKQYYPRLSEVEIVKVLLSRDFAEKRLEERMMLQNGEDIPMSVETPKSPPKTDQPEQNPWPVS